MLVKFIMTPNVECISPDTTLQEAAGRMRSLDVGLLPVCGEGSRLVGMLTDRDIAIRSSAEGLDPKVAKVRDVMTEDVIYCFEDQDLQEATQLMEIHRVRRLVVLNEDRRLAGILSLGDLTIRANPKEAVEVLREISEPPEMRF